MVEKNIWYTVTKGSDDGTLQVGDTIKLCDGGYLLCVETIGWIEEQIVDEVMVGAEIEVDEDLLELRRKKIEAELELLKKLASGDDDAETR